MNGSVPVVKGKRNCQRAREREKAVKDVLYDDFTSVGFNSHLFPQLVGKQRGGGVSSFITHAGDGYTDKWVLTKILF